MSTFYVWRRKGRKIKTTIPGGKHRLPQIRHGTQADAETEAKRLSGIYPESCFLVLAVIGQFRETPHPNIPSVKV